MFYFVSKETQEKYLELLLSCITVADCLSGRKQNKRLPKLPLPKLAFGYNPGRLFSITHPLGLILMFIFI